jgi:probable phosphoglycerate mutase
VSRNTLVGWDSDLGTPTTFVLMRHGETTHTRERRFSGGTGRGGDPELTDLGLWQAARAGEHLARIADDPGTHHASHPAIDVIVASPMARTRATAQIVGERLGLPVDVVEGVAECDFGVWDGLTYDEVTRGWPEELTRWFASTDHAPPGGESFEQVQRRVAQVRQDLLATYRGATILVVTHVTPIKSFVRQTLAAPTPSLFRMELAPASFSSIASFVDGVESLRFFNDTSHLRGAGAPMSDHREGHS